MQKVDEVFDTSRKLTYKIVGKFKHEIPYIVIMFISIALTGILNFIKFGWSWETLKSASFWGDTALTTISNMLMAISSTLMSSDNILLDINKGLGKQAFELENKINEVRLSIKNDIDLFLADINRERKIKAWENKINKELLLVKNRFTEKDTLEYANYMKKLPYKATWNVKKRIKLEQQLEKDYIEKNFYILNVKYNVITRRMIENGALTTEQDGTLAKNTKVLVNGLLPKFILSISITVFMSSFLYDLREDMTWVVVFPILIKLMTIFFNYMYGRNFAPSYVEQTTINNLLVRREWLTKYADWRERNGTTTK